MTAGSSGATSGEELGPQSLWADEEEKKFYEDLVELRGKVPNALLGVAEEEKVEEAEVKEDVQEETVEGEEEKDAARIDDEDAAEEPECVRIPRALRQCRTHLLSPAGTRSLSSKRPSPIHPFLPAPPRS